MLLLSPLVCFQTTGPQEWALVCNIFPVIARNVWLFLFPEHSYPGKMISDALEKEEDIHPYLWCYHRLFKDTWWFLHSKNSSFRYYSHMVIWWGAMTFMNWIMVIQLGPLFAKSRLFIIIIKVCLGCHNKILQRGRIK